MRMKGIQAHRASLSSNKRRQYRYAPHSRATQVTSSRSSPVFPRSRKRTVLNMRVIASGRTVMTLDSSRLSDRALRRRKPAVVSASRSRLTDHYCPARASGQSL